MDISKLTKDELLELNKRVVAKIRDIQAKEQLSAALDFVPGDRVYFESKKWPMKHAGVVVRVNGKTIKVKTDTGEMWNVSATLLKHEEPEAA